ncbi:MAG: hypothetical protein ACHQK9_04135 [Reyranellales bacterium]
MPRFQKGKPPGPGRPCGRRNESALLFDELGSEGTEKLIRVVRECAEQGNMRAASIVLARTWPHRRGRPVALDLPDVATAAGLVQAQAKVIADMANSKITPDEAASVASVLEAQRRAIETHDHERRIKALEEKKAETPWPGENG